MIIKGGNASNFKIQEFSVKSKNPIPRFTGINDFMKTIPRLMFSIKKQAVYPPGGTRH